MPKVRLVCWKEDLALEKARILKEAGIPVDASPLHAGGGHRQFRTNPPAAVLIDLDRLPSLGREVAVALRCSKSTRHIPIVFAGGLEEKVARIRQELPDAFFTDWRNVVRVLQKAVKSAPAEPVLPLPHMQRYAGSSLVKKLGLAPKTAKSYFRSPNHWALWSRLCCRTRCTRQTHGVHFRVPSKAPAKSRTASHRHRGSARDMPNRDRRRNRNLSDCARHSQPIQTASYPTRERRRASHLFPDKRSV